MRRASSSAWSPSTWPSVGPRACITHFCLGAGRPGPPSAPAPPAHGKPPPAPATTGPKPPPELPHNPRPPGLVQEGKAEKAAEAIKAMLSSTGGRGLIPAPAASLFGGQRGCRWRRGGPTGRRLERGFGKGKRQGLPHPGRCPESATSSVGRGLLPTAPPPQLLPLKHRKTPPQTPPLEQPTSSAAASALPWTRPSWCRGTWWPSRAATACPRTCGSCTWQTSRFGGWAVLIGLISIGRSCSFAGG